MHVYETAGLAPHAFGDFTVPNLAQAENCVKLVDHFVIPLTIIIINRYCTSHFSEQF